MTSRSDDGAAKEVPVRRKPHPKSRLGCKTCKSRRIKCDEHKPQCRNCIRHAVRCDFLTSVPGPGPDFQSGDGELAIHDLELLHNFTTRTYATIAEGVEIRDLYRVTAVQLGLKADYMLRAVLAMSALHLAHYRPSQRDHYVYLAMRHHQIATRKAMEVLKEPLDITKAETLFIFSVMTLFFSMANSANEEDQANALNAPEMPQWIFFHGGTTTLITFLINHLPELRRGPLQLIFNDGGDRMQKRQSDTLHRSRSTSIAPTPTSPEEEEVTAVTAQSDVHHHLDSVQNMIERREHDEALRATYVKAIDGLHTSFTVAANTGGNDATDAFLWLYLVSEDLMPLLREPLGPKQEAVVLIAFFAALLKKMDGRWWAKGCGEHLLKRSWAMLDDEHKLWVSWPVEETGWIPG